MRSPALPIALLTLAVSFAGLPARSHDMNPKQPIPQITVTGNAEVRVSPDEATVRVGVQAQAKNARDAQLEVNRIAGAILAGTKQLGIPVEAVQTSQLNLSPVYSSPRPNDPDQQPRVTGYQASNVVTVRVADLTKVGPVLDAAIAGGANRIDGVDFQVRDDRAAREQALRLAGEDARRKAKAITEALGVTLGAVLEVQEGGGISPPQPFEGGFVRMAMADAATPVAVGQSSLSATVTVRYRIDN